MPSFASTFRSAALVAGIVLLPACAAGDRARETDRGERARVRVVMQPWLAHASLYIAQAEGYFAEQGLDVEFVHMTNTEGAVPLLVTGEVDVLPGHAAPGLLNAIARGAPVRMVAEKGRYGTGECSSIALLVRPEFLEAADNGAALKRMRRLSVDPQAASVYFVEKAFEKAGLSMARLEQLSVPPMPEIQALANGSLDVALAGEPFLTRTLRSGHAVVWQGASEVLADEEFSFIFFGATLLRDRALGDAFMTAYLKGVRQYLQGKTDRNVEVVAAAMRDDREVVRAACWPAQRADGHVVMDNVMRYQDWLQRRGLIDAVIPADRLWDPGFVRAASRALGGDLPEE